MFTPGFVSLLLTVPGGPKSKPLPNYQSKSY